MSIRRQLFISAWLFGAVVLAVLLTLILSSREIDRSLEENAFAARITTDGISGLRVVIVDYILIPGERPLAQWLQRHATLKKMLNTPLYDGTSRQDIIQDLRRRNERLGEVFSKFTRLHTEHKNYQALATLRKQVEDRLITQLMVITQEMISDAHRLQENSLSRLREVQQRANLTVWIEVVAMMLLIAVNLLLAVRVVLNPIRVLQRGTEIVGAGDLTHRTNITLDNEIGALSQAFDAMTAKLARSQAKLEHNAVRLQATVQELETFSYSVSHDLRAPLRGIDGWSLALLEDCGAQLGEKGRGYLDIVRAETQRMASLIDDMLQLSRVSRGELERAAVDLSDLARTVAKRLQEANPDRHIEFLIEPGLAAKADVKLTEIALTNLLDNACKFSGPRPLARIEFSRSVAQDPATRTQENVFCVRDNGVGFDMAQADKLFGAFQRLHTASEFSGTGIGLATVQRIVNCHGGRIWAEARPDQGASFYFTLEESA